MWKAKSFIMIIKIYVSMHIQKFFGINKSKSQELI